MATDQLKDAWEQLEKLSPEKQNMIAEQILEAIEEAKWDETFASPESQAYAKKRREEVTEQYRAGKTKKTFQEKVLQNSFNDDFEGFYHNLPPSVQRQADKAFAGIQEILSTRKWNAIWKNPEAIALAKKLAEESREDEVEDGGFDCL